MSTTDSRAGGSSPVRGHFFLLNIFFSNIIMADLIIGGSKGAPGMRFPWGSAFFHFYAVFGKKN